MSTLKPINPLSKLNQLDKTAEQLDYERDQAQLAKDNLFTPTAPPDSPIERWSMALLFVAMGAGLLYIGLPFVLLALDGAAALKWQQRIMISGVGLIPWLGALWVFVLAYRRAKGD